ncbi:MAG: hypothetical protein COA57_04265 [Flavobacteriales bacterium]|nr:MAG: hypothetical protein COA57_04265 [Flavobacteriales bacterium]
MFYSDKSHAESVIPGRYNIESVTDFIRKQSEKDEEITEIKKGLEKDYFDSEKLKKYLETCIKIGAKQVNYNSISELSNAIVFTENVHLVKINFFLKLCQFVLTQKKAKPFHPILKKIEPNFKKISDDTEIILDVMKKAYNKIKREDTEDYNNFLLSVAKEAEKSHRNKPANSIRESIGV